MAGKFIFKGVFEMQISIEPAASRFQITRLGLAQLGDGIAQYFHISRSRGSRQIGSEILVTTEQSDGDPKSAALMNYFI